MPDCSADRIETVEHLADGENNTIHKVSYLDADDTSRQVVVRVGSPDGAAKLRAEREATVLRKVGGIAGPKLYAFSADVHDINGSLMCLEFLDGSQRDLRDVGADGLEQLGRLLQWLHAQPVDDLTNWAPARTSLAAYVQERWQAHLASRLGAIRAPLPEALRGQLRAAVAVVADTVEELTDLAAAAHHDQLALLHADISGANLLWAPDPVLIDWEYTRLGDPADELAYLFTQNALDARQRDAIWRSYSAGTSHLHARETIERVRCWEPITILGSVLWWLDAWSRAEAAESTGQAETSLPHKSSYYLAHAVRRFDSFPFSATS
jgi:aminoglycoside phosphotransferase (APT) family kinase protein